MLRKSANLRNGSIWQRGSDVGSSYQPRNKGSSALNACSAVQCSVVQRLTNGKRAFIPVGDSSRVRP